jgi:hypothetical protein
MKILLLVSLYSTIIFATPEVELKKTSHNFLSSILKRDQKLYKESTSEKFFKSQKEQGFIKRVFSKSPKKITGLDFDMKFQKGLVDKDYYFVNIKEKNQKRYDDSWFIMKKIKGKFVIDGIHHFEN